MSDCIHRVSSCQCEAPPQTLPRFHPAPWRGCPLIPHRVLRAARPQPQGRKMSKSLGNVIDPLDSIAEYGTDALRFTLATGTTPGQGRGALLLLCGMASCV